MARYGEKGACGRFLYTTSPFRVVLVSVVGLSSSIISAVTADNEVDARVRVCVLRDRAYAHASAAGYRVAVAVVMCARTQRRRRRRCGARRGRTGCCTDDGGGGGGGEKRRPASERESEGVGGGEGEIK